MKSIATPADLKQILENSSVYCSNGYFITKDAQAIAREIVEDKRFTADYAMAIVEDEHDKIIAYAINLEDEHLICSVSGAQIPPAYEPEN